LFVAEGFGGANRTGVQAWFGLAGHDDRQSCDVSSQKMILQNGSWNLESKLELWICFKRALLNIWHTLRTFKHGSATAPGALKLKMPCQATMTIFLVTNFADIYISPSPQPLSILNRPLHLFHTTQVNSLSDRQSRCLANVEELPLPGAPLLPPPLLSNKPGPPQQLLSLLGFNRPPHQLRLKHNLLPPPRAQVFLVRWLQLQRMLMHPWMRKILILTAV